MLKEKIATMVREALKEIEKRKSCLRCEMKIVNIFICLFILNAPISYSQTEWFKIYSDTTKMFESVYFINPDTGWVVGLNGTIMKTSDSGNNWTLQASNTTSALYSICFINSDTGWIVGNLNTILRTTDGGVNWSLRPNPGSGVLESVVFLNSNIGYAIGGVSILKTTDGGENWITKITNAITISDWLKDCFFINPDIGWAVGRGSRIIKTTDGGESWASQYYLGGLFDDLYSVYFLNPDTGYTVGYNGKKYKTTDGGKNWIILTGGNTNHLQSLQFINDTGWAVGSYGTILRTDDGGKNWIQQISGTSNQLRSVYFVNIHNGFTVGYGGTILKTTSINTSVDINNYSNLTTFKLSQNYPNPFNPSTTIQFSLRQPNHVLLRILDISGKEVAVLLNEQREAGAYYYSFDGSKLSSGTYFIELRAGSYSCSKKMMLVK